MHAIERGHAWNAPGRCSDVQNEQSVLQTPNEVLPPPPSEEVDTEHWERAMFRDRQERLDRPRSRVLSDTVSSWVSMRRS